tara:strand:- start:283 stop:882 length:600 start_codon:yes stop_codon:yes gene_type:complete
MSSIKLKHSGGNSVIIAAPSSNPASDRTITLPSNADGTMLTTTNPKAGNIIQVEQSFKTNDFGHTGNTNYTDITGLNVNITPTSSSNKVLIYISITISCGNITTFRLVRDSTNIALSDTASNRPRGFFQLNKTGDNNTCNTGSIMFLDSPSTTSQVNYKVQFALEHTSSVMYINRSVADPDSNTGARSTSGITAMEVAA